MGENDTNASNEGDPINKSIDVTIKNDYLSIVLEQSAFQMLITSSAEFSWLENWFMFNFMFNLWENLFALD